MVDTVAAPRSMSSSHDPVATVAAPIRHRVRALLVGWDVRAETVDDALLVVEELVANVLEHAGTRFELVVRMTGDVLHVAVRDRNVRSPHLRPFDPYAARGRGLQLVSIPVPALGCEHHSEGQDGVGRAAGVSTSTIGQ